MRRPSLWRDGERGSKDVRRVRWFWADLHAGDYWYAASHLAACIGGEIERNCHSDHKSIFGGRLFHCAGSGDLGEHCDKIEK